ncbi:stomatin-like protein 2, mitochondrial [Lingula anatina]|uniref:Stomatin-like protein 2, mitochondrial n=1 Tax=Lingula anatina TaxID=7574 RepID=A0A1S3JA76_LINAN|nr:stomatin-like protein 2, mitochondrial [Lingula anatina]|eukprot:XP_013406784.1 stomatin-like protein 2, mitochondrial [Lingula anatina]
MLSKNILRLRILRPLPQQVNHHQTRYRSDLPINYGVLFVPQQEAWVVERFGKFLRILEPGLNFQIPVIDSIRYVQSLKELAINIPQQSAITVDNVTIAIDGVLYLKVMDPYKASYGVEDPEYAITQLAQTTMRSEIGKIELDTVFRERETLNTCIVESINKASNSWGIECLRYEIRDIKMPEKVAEAMQLQVEAERKKRASILESEGVKVAEINVAEGKKQATILASEAVRTENINRALGEAEAILAIANARADATRAVAKAIGAQNGMNAVSMTVAEQYISAFGNLAKTGNTVLLPTNTGDISSMVGQAMTIYKTLSTPSQTQLIEDAKGAETAENEEEEIETPAVSPGTSVEAENDIGYSDPDSLGPHEEPDPTKEKND